MNTDLFLSALPLISSWDRFGINLLMYAMSGNYKSDQARIEEILRRRQLTQ